MHTSKTSLVSSLFSHWWGILVSLVYVGLISLWWPGILRPDSILQLSQAKTGVFSDHHPAMMAYLWQFLDKLYPGPGPMLVINLVLLCSALFTFGRCVPKRWRPYYLAVIFFPPVFCYIGFVLKDISFTYCYLLSTALLSYHSVYKRPLSNKMLMLLGILLFYGTAIKYQAIFILPVLTLWIAYTRLGYQASLKTGAFGAAGYGLLFAAITIFNHFTVVTKDHSWQFVKLYDLAGMSLQLKQDLLPDFVKQSNYSQHELERRYNTINVDPLTHLDHPILIKGRNEEERNKLWNIWFEAVVKHPQAYLNHRIALMNTLLHMSPIKRLDQVKSNIDAISPRIQTILRQLESSGIITALQWITSMLIYMPFLILYILLGLKWSREDRSPYATPLLILNLIALWLIMVLFVFSMATDARYIYLSVCCFHFSHPFAYLSYKRAKAPLSDVLEQGNQS